MKSCTTLLAKCELYIFFCCTAAGAVHQAVADNAGFRQSSPTAEHLIGRCHACAKGSTPSGGRAACVDRRHPTWLEVCARSIPAQP